MGKKFIKAALLLCAICAVLLGLTGNKTVAFASTVEPVEEISLEQMISQIQLEPIMNQAIGTKQQLELKNNTLEEGTYSLNWMSSNPSVAQVNAENGVLDAITQGNSIITCVLTVGESQYHFSSNVTVTDPKFSQSVYYVTTKSRADLIIQGTTTKELKLISSNNSIVLPAQEGSVVTGMKYGTAIITVEVDRRYITCQVVVSAPKINYTNLFLITKKSATLKVTGHSMTTPVTFTSSNKAVVSVSSKGKVKGLKKGSAVITITMDGKVYTTYVSVGKSKVIKSVKRAYAVLGSRYSQKLRMRKGYYDCSSLVWRTYSPSGYRFGHKTYAPTAAAQAKRMVKEKKVLSYKALSESKLLPGDLLYMKGTYKNGRYKNINHVAIYLGNGRILHAKNEKAGVCIENYNTYKKRIVLISRL